jgi:methylaspartate ammonia-lyase
MKIIDVILTESLSGFYFDDQKAIKANRATSDGFNYLGDPMTLGFSKIRMPGQAVTIGLLLEDGLIAYGDCAAVQYSGAGGRDPLFLAKDFIPFIKENITPLLIGEDVSNFRKLAEKYDHLVVDGKRIHTAIRYGLTQALLNATALASRLTIAEVIRKEYGINDTKYEPVPIFTQSGDDRYINADKMIIKGADALPHALINNVSKLGENGEKLLDYVHWLVKRIITLRNDESYNPVIHLDVYGTIGIIFNNDSEKIAQYLMTLEEAAKPFSIRVEGPIDTGDREGTLKGLIEITRYLDEHNSKLEVVADEWCNTLEDIIEFADKKAGHMIQIKTPDLGGVNNVAEAIIYCNKAKVGSYCGGTCNETNLSAEVTTAIAIACKASQILAKPGMGCDEGLMICKNQMNRIIALSNNKVRRV